MTPQVKSIIAHVTLIGWIVALIVNSNDKDELTNFYLRQVLGLYLIGIIGSFIQGIRLIVGLVVFILWLMSLVGAVKKQPDESPYIGRYFQEWFRNLV